MNRSMMNGLLYESWDQPSSVRCVCVSSTSLAASTHWTARCRAPTQASVSAIWITPACSTSHHTSHRSTTASAHTVRTGCPTTASQGSSRSSSCQMSVSWWRTMEFMYSWTEPLKLLTSFSHCFRKSWYLPAPDVSPKAALEFQLLSRQETQRGTVKMTFEVKGETPA